MSYITIIVGLQEPVLDDNATVMQNIEVRIQQYLPYIEHRDRPPGQIRLDYSGLPELEV